MCSCVSQLHCCVLVFVVQTCAKIMLTSCELCDATMMPKERKKRACSRSESAAVIVYACCSAIGKYTHTHTHARARMSLCYRSCATIHTHTHMHKHTHTSSQ